MTEEQKDLLLKDLCARVPYEVKVYDVKSCVNSSFMNLNHVNGTVKEVFISYMHKCRTAPIEDIKPYLFPLSSMTWEKECQYREVIASALNHYEVYDWFNKNHFDYRGLISMGLAIDATGKNIY